MRKKRTTYYVDPAVIIENASKAYRGKELERAIAFSTTFNDLLEEKGVDQKQLARDVEISTGSISKFRNGKAIPKTFDLLTIANYLGVDCHYLLTGIEAKHYEVADYTGLSNDAIKKLHELNKYPTVGWAQRQTIEAVNQLLESEEGNVVLWYVYLYLTSRFDGACVVDDTNHDSGISDAVTLCEGGKRIIEMPVSAMDKMFLVSIQDFLSQLKTKVAEKGGVHDGKQNG